MLIDAHEDLNLKNDDGDTALIIAISYGFNDIVKMIIQAGADVSIKDNNGNDALAWAKAKNNRICIKLLEEGASHARID